MFDCSFKTDDMHSIQIHYIQIHKYATIQKFGIIKIFLMLLKECLPRLHIFDKKIQYKL